MNGTALAKEGRLHANRLARHVALLGLASGVSGVLIGGVGGRIVMRVTALAAGPEMVGRLTENGNRIGEFTIGGTLILIGFAAASGAIFGSVVVVGSEPWLRWMGALKGLGFGLAALAAFHENLFDSFDFLILEPATLNVGMFVGLFVAFGLTIPALYWLLDRKLPEAAEHKQPGYLILDALGLVALFLTVLFFTSPDFCLCEPTYEIGALLLVMTASTGIRYGSSVVNALPDWLTRTASFTGYGSLVLLLAIGLSRMVDQIQQIL